MIKEVTHAHLGPIWYQTEPSDVPLFPKPVSGLGLFLAVSYSKQALAGSFLNSFCEDLNRKIYYSTLYCILTKVFDLCLLCHFPQKPGRRN